MVRLYTQLVVHIVNHFAIALYTVCGTHMCTVVHVGCTAIAKTTLCQNIVCQNEEHPPANLLGLLLQDYLQQNVWNRPMCTNNG